MKVETILNGTVKLVLIAENPIEQAVLDQLSKTPEVSVSLMTNTTQILTKTLDKGALLLETKSSK